MTDKDEGPTWDQIDQAFGKAWSYLGMPKTTPFIEISIPQRKRGHYELPPVIYELVEVEHVDTLLNDLRREGPLVQRYTIHKGITNTVEALWIANGSPEETRAVWAVAIGQDIEDGYHGKMYYRVPREAERFLSKRDFGTIYHHRNRALPGCIFPKELMGLSWDHNFEDLEQFACFAAISAASILVGHRFLRITPAPGLQPVKDSDVRDLEKSKFTVITNEDK